MGVVGGWGGGMGGWVGFCLCDLFLVCSLFLCSGRGGGDTERDRETDRETYIKKVSALAKVVFV